MSKLNGMIPVILLGIVCLILSVSNVITHKALQELQSNQLVMHEDVKKLVNGYNEQLSKIEKLENRIKQLEQDVDDIPELTKLPVTDLTFYAGDEATSGPIGANGKRLTHKESIALNKPLIEQYGLKWGDKIVIFSESHPEWNGTYTLEDCGVGRNDTADAYVKSVSYIPSWGRAKDLKVYSIKV